MANAEFEEIVPRGGSSVELFYYEAPQNAEMLGDIAILVDMAMLPDALRYLGALIAGTFRRSYYTANTQRPQTAFARALRTVNGALAEEALTGSGQWVGMLYGLVVASDGTTLLLASSGGCVAYLKRDGRTMEIPLEAGEGTRPFGSYTAGALMEGDTLIFGGRSSLIAQQAETLFQRSPDQLVKRLKKSGTTCLALSVVKTSSAGAPGIRVSLKDRLAQTSGVLISIRNISMGLMHGVRGTVSRLRLPKLPSLIGMKHPAVWARMRKKHEVHVQDEIPSTKTQRRKLGDMTASIRTVLKRLPRPKSSLARLKLKKPTLPPLPAFPRRRIAAAGGFVLLLAVALALTLSPGGGEEPDKNLAAAIGVARSALEKGETKIILGEKAEAIAAFTKGLAAIEGVDGTGNLYRELIDRRNSLSGIRIATTIGRLSFSGFPVGIDADRIAVTQAPDGTAIALGGASHPTIWLNGTIALTEGTFFVLPLEFQTGVLSIDLTIGSAGFAVATAEGFALLDVENRVLEMKHLSGEEEYVMLASAENTIFTLTKRGTIRSIAFTESGVRDRAWLTSPDERLLEGIDMLSYQNEPYVLLKDNTFLRIRRGLRDIHYTIEGFAWEGVAQAFDAFENGRLAILDTKNARILMTEQNGDIIEQYEVPGAEAGEDIAIAPNQESVFVLTTTGVLEVMLPPPLPKATE